MSARQLEIPINLKSNEDSNYFLRSLWAELRRTFGKCAWQYSPWKDGEKKRVYFGYIDIGIEATTLGVSIAYKQKGVVEKIFIEEVSGVLSKDIENKIFDSVNQAITNRNNFNNYQFQSTIESNRGAIENYTSLCFRLSVVDSKTNYFLFKVKGFDKFDAATESRRILVKILDFLSICTNAAFAPISSSICDEDEDQFKIDDEEVFFENFDWIDNHPRVDNYLALWKSQKDFINNILSGEIRLNHPLIRASSHFHEAQKILFQNSINNNSTELFSVLLVSSLEVATELYPLESSRCKECGQKKYSIRQRVKELVRLHLNQYIEGFIDDYYSARSEYLHTGILFSDTSYVGVSIPQLDPLSNSGCRSQSPALPINLSEYTGYILRNIFISKNIADV